MSAVLMMLLGAVCLGQVLDLSLATWTVLRQGDGPLQFKVATV